MDDFSSRIAEEFRNLTGGGFVFFDNDEEKRNREEEEQQLLNRDDEAASEINKESLMVVGSEGMINEKRGGDGDGIERENDIELGGDPLLPHSVNFGFEDATSGEEMIASLTNTVEYERYDERKKEFAKETILSWEDRCNRHTILSTLLQLFAAGLQISSSFSHLSGERVGLQHYVKIEKLKKIITPPALFGTILSHSSDSLEGTDRLIQKAKKHQDFWGRLSSWWPKILLTLVAIFICFSASIGDANKTWKENKTDSRELQLFWTIYNTVLHLPIKLWGTIDFLCVFTNNFVAFQEGAPRRPTEVQLNLLTSWVENMDAKALFSGVAFDRRQWPASKEEKPLRSKLFWAILKCTLMVVAGTMLFVSTVIKTESSQQGLSELFGFVTSIVLSLISQMSYVSLSAKWPYRTLNKPFELMKKKEESSDMLRVHYPRCFAALYFPFLFFASLACFGAFYSGSNVLKLPSSLSFFEGFFIYTYGIHFVLYATCAGVEFLSRCFGYLRETKFFDPTGVFRLRAATKQALFDSALADDFLVK
mmetsp:Transcript_744/g.1088  ORF Transcript_744/g.1088 Transcript_744/m.1088 type:complete len:536 (+) Transcript_744:144-1751(+)|eukprot:CAMPEP_0201488886 /NCGR_PEP_ID=MMETSP0151_2-20130828/20069_1 /ASSEMBLY_ACC=CAM_ASM_000257 /TAXON_ID=200890 /ORGANISM="Paramoeba atlantica, Strain 621/1 / CCAP 1560/9" /LENGTH=535 /DNA_ID=CAMNT_0047874285 /DNA_START=110 /DNA_END=1720 /DNA_ORIENTATION=-